MQRRYREVATVRAPPGRLPRPPPPLPAPPGRTLPPLDPAFVADATVGSSGRSVWFGQKVALTELSCSFGPGRHRPARAQRRRQDHAHAGDRRAAAAQRGRGAGAGRRPAPRPRGAALDRARARGRGRPAAPLTARQLVRYTAALHRVDDRTLPDRCLAHGRAARGGRPQGRRVQQGHAPAGQGGRRPGHRAPRAGARRAAQRRRPGPAGGADRAVPARSAPRAAR